MGQGGVGVVGVDSHLGLKGRARQASVVGLCPTLALGLPALVDRPQILVESLATGSQTASLTGEPSLSLNQSVHWSSSYPIKPSVCDSCCLLLFQGRNVFPFHGCFIFQNSLNSKARHCYRQCQGTPGRCVDPCTNNVETGNT